MIQKCVTSFMDYPKRYIWFVNLTKTFPTRPVAPVTKMLLPVQKSTTDEIGILKKKTISQFRGRIFSQFENVLVPGWE